MNSISGIKQQHGTEDGMGNNDTVKISKQGSQEPATCWHGSQGRAVVWAGLLGEAACWHGSRGRAVVWTDLLGEAAVLCIHLGVSLGLQ